MMINIPIWLGSIIGLSIFYNITFAFSIWRYREIIKLQKSVITLLLKQCDDNKAVIDKIEPVLNTLDKILSKK